MNSTESLNKWIGSGSPWVWLSAGMVSLNLVMVFGLLLLISVRGLGHFWPAAIESIELRENDGTTTSLLGNVIEDEIVSAVRVRGTGATVPEGVEFVRRYLIKVGNRDVSGADFVWVNETDITSREIPLDSSMVEREEWGNFYGNLLSVKLDGEIIASGASAWGAMQEGIARKTQIRNQRSKKIKLAKLTTPWNGCACAPSAWN
jgi:phosphate transport system permease protein